MQATCWLMHTFRDLSLAATCLGELRGLYPTDTIVVIADGEAGDEARAVVERFGAVYHAGERLFAIERGGEITERLLRLGLDSGAGVIIKIDPDTLIRRRFRSLPRGDTLDVSGSLQSQARVDGLRSIQGGCIVITRAAAAALVASRVLLDPRLAGRDAVWVGCVATRRRAQDQRLTSIDWTLGWACRELSIPLRSHPEVYARWAPLGLRDLLGVCGKAAIHPRPEGTGALPLRILARWLRRQLGSAR